ncbi:MAG: DUF2764 domain-containing protein [Phocaeicola sp.]
MTNYYCLVAGLPDLTLEDGKLSYTVASFKTEIYPELSDEDKKIVDIFYLKFDHIDLLRLLKNKETITASGGNYTSEELLALISAVREQETPDNKFPSYLSKFIEAYLLLPTEELFKAEDLLASYYYAYAMKCSNQFISKWYEFNLDLNNLLSAWSARKYQMEVAPVVVGDTEVCEVIRTSNARDFGLSDSLDYFEPILRISELEDLIEREKKLDLLKWNWMEDEMFFNYFTVERLYAFLVRLEMIERWISMDAEKGSERFREIINQLKSDVQIPEEFR